MIVYRTNLDDCCNESFTGFCVGWRKPLCGDTLFRILKNSYKTVVAIDDQTNKTVGFINSLSDGIQFAFIPMLEVLPEYQGRGIGTNLLNCMLEELSSIPNIDLMCEQELQPFYEKFGMFKSYGMVIRK